MSLDEFLENLTLEEIEELKRLKLENQRNFNFSSIKMSDLKKIFNIKQNLINKDRFDNWFNSGIEVNSDIDSFLFNLLKKVEPLLKYYKEEDLKIHFLSQIFSKIDFLSYDYEFRDFYNEKLTYKTDNFILNGEVDFVISKGLKDSEKPYFFIQEFKRDLEFSNPEPQLLAELISAVELNNFKSIKGAYIVGAIWYFVILERLERHKYIYYVSQNFDSTKIDDLKDIYKNLLYVKSEIIELIESEES